MPKIYTPQTLPEVLQYQNNHQVEESSNKGWQMVQFARNCGVADLLPVVISDVNKGRFVGCEDYQIILSGMSPTIQEIMQMQDQEVFLDPVRVMRCFNQGFDIHGYKNGSGDYFVQFHTEESWGIGAEIFMDMTKQGIDSEKVRKAIAPYISQDKLDVVVREIMQRRRISRAPEYAGL